MSIAVGKVVGGGRTLKLWNIAAIVCLGVILAVTFDMALSAPVKTLSEKMILTGFRYTTWSLEPRASNHSS